MAVTVSMVVAPEAAVNLKIAYSHTALSMTCQALGSQTEVKPTQSCPLQKTKCRFSPILLANSAVSISHGRAEPAFSELGSEQHNLKLAITEINEGGGVISTYLESLQTSIKDLIHLVS